MNPSFEQLNIHPDYVKKLRELGIEEPTQIQSDAIPPAIAGKDIVAQSQTGTGKTLAYVLPVLHRINPAEKKVQAVILVPTRELGMQILGEVERLAGSGVLAQALIGGAAVQRQIDKLRLHPQIVVGTPGRVMELIKARKLTMHFVKTVVVDEVDQVFELGAAGDVEAVLKSTLRDRQTLFFSATVPDKVEGLARRWMRDPQWIRVNPGQRTAQTLEHLYFMCEERDKVDTLRRLVRLYNPKAGIVFVNGIEDIGEVVAKLKFAGLSIEALYAEAGKVERAKTMNAFREGRFQLLLATDVAARGLDLPGVTHVINYDLPIDADHYVHRAGRTGRMGRKGLCVSIATRKEQFIIEKFEKTLGIGIERKAMLHGSVVEPEKLRGSAARKRNGVAAPASARVSAHKPAAASAQRAAEPGSRRPPEAAASRGKAEQSGAEPREQARTAAAKPPRAEGGSRPAAAAQSGGKPVKSAKEKERERKNKGAPRWLKEKQDK